MSRPFDGVGLPRARLSYFGITALASAENGLYRSKPHPGVSARMAGVQRLRIQNFEREVAQVNAPPAQPLYMTAKSERFPPAQ
jgi:hypothetical protein